MQVPCKGTVEVPFFLAGSVTAQRRHRDPTDSGLRFLVNAVEAQDVKILLWGLRSTAKGSRHPC